ncbi:MAG: 16S rRNA (cytosine(1402)-N(4))-methyltransferase RsmH [Acidobacteria bacterium]|nr:16S rRNA (cytosine(1402)-N(4))-methyltransferase RsmH [Acidobacteriota bacterium]
MARQHRNPGDLHKPVMLDPVVEALSKAPAGVVVDATVGLGGHADALLTQRADIRLVGLDRDDAALELADLRLARWAGRYELCHSDYRALHDLAERRGWAPLAGILVDMGVSSLQLDDPDRGFSFRQDGPLDMRMDRREKRTAAELVNRLDAGELKAIIKDYGEEPHAARIARAVVSAREAGPITSTAELAGLVEATIPQRGPRRIHPATRTFQALRIAVNRELDGIQDFVVAAAQQLAPGGRLAVIAFHSLEDRAVKRAYRSLASDCECPPELPQCVCDKQAEVKLLSSKPLRADEAEVAANPRARSAKLRVLEKI